LFRHIQTNKDKASATRSTGTPAASHNASKSSSPDTMASAFAASAAATPAAICSYAVQKPLSYKLQICFIICDGKRRFTA
jgi:hypothetical protein